MAARVTVFYEDGTSVTKETFFPKGDPENPATEKELIEKFLRLAGKVIPEEKAQNLSIKIMKLDEVKAVSSMIEHISNVETLDGR